MINPGQFSALENMPRSAPAPYKLLADGVEKVVVDRDVLDRVKIGERCRLFACTERDR